VTEPLGIALELAARRKALAARLSPWGRRLAFPDLYRPPHDIPAPVAAKPKAALKPEAPKRAPLDDKLPATLVIAAICAAQWGIEVAALLGPSHKAIHARPRHAAQAIIRQELGLSTPDIGRVFKRDHSSVLHALTRHPHSYENEPHYRERYDAALAEWRQYQTTRNAAATSDTAAAAGDQVDGVPRPLSHLAPAKITTAEAVNG